MSSSRKSRQNKREIYLKEIRIQYRIKKIKDKILGRKIADASTVAQLFKELQNETKEKLITINLDSQNKILCFEVVALGSLNAIYLRPGEVFRTSIMVNAHAAIVVHNHPTGDPKPSQADKNLTEELKTIAKAMGLNFHDHVIIGLEEYFSFAENFLM